MSRIGDAILLTLCNVLSLGSLAIFAWGFFGAKPYLSELAENDASHFASPSPPTSGHFDKIIFMVIDALRRLAQFV
jgi:hypothetical protein